MKIETLIQKHYSLEVIEIDSAVTRLEIFEKGDDSEPIGALLKQTGADGAHYYQWRRIYGPVQSGTAYTDAQLRAAIKAHVFGA
jgi:hypothetical protein